MSAQKRPVSGAMSGLLAFVGFSALAGVLVTAAVTPALAVTGMAANNGITMFENLPSYLEIGALPQKSTIYAKKSDGSEVALASFYDQNREEVGWDKINQFVKDAAVSGEDPRFYQHNGVDLQGTLRATAKLATGGGDVQGGSSITQQYVKNVLINNGVSQAKTQKEKEAAYALATKQTPDRKLKEMRYAIALEKKTSKKDILTGYLNIALFGGRVYGIEAAANYYYNKTAETLTLPEAASLVAIVNNPEKFRLDQPDSETNGAHTKVDGKEVPYAADKSRRDYILDQMLKYKKITQQQHDEAVKTPVAPVITQPSTGCETAGGAAFFCDYVTQVVKHAYDDPNTPDVNEGALLLKEGGLQIHTTLDLDLQGVAEDAMAKNVPVTDPRFKVGSVAVSIEVGTGRVLAMAQNKKYSQDQSVLNSSPDYTAINFSTPYDYGGSLGFQPGSTFKTFTLAEWLNEGHSLRETFNGSRRTFTSFPDSCNGTWHGSFNPKNDDGTGANNAVDATKYSVNTAFVSMGQQLDLCKIKKTAEAFGVDRADGLQLGQKPQQNKKDGTYVTDAKGNFVPTTGDVFSPSAILGTEEVAPISMVAAFAGMANNGTTCSPIVIDSIQKADGTKLDPPKSNCVQSVQPNVAHAMDYAMQQTFNGGTATASNTHTGVPHIGKTGTTDGNKDTWMDGASTKVATAVWVGATSANVDSNGNAYWQDQRRISFDSGSVATARHRMWKEIMTFADNKYGGDKFPDPDPSAFKQVLVDIPQVTGLTLDQAKQAIEAAGFVFQDGGPKPSNLPAGQVIGTDPTGQAGRGTTINVFTSDGKGVAVPDLTGMTKDQAQAALEAVGLQLAGDGKGKVTAQNPAAGSVVAPGATVTATFSGGGAGTGGGGILPPTPPTGGGG